MNKHRLFEIICVVFLVLFIALISSGDSYSDKTVDEVWEVLSAEIDFDSLISMDKNEITEEFDIDLSLADSFLYYASDAVMNVEEVFIIKLKEDARSDQIKEKIKERVTDKQQLFEGYAPEQSDLLKNYILCEENGFILYAVTDEWADLLTLFTAYV